MGLKKVKPPLLCQQAPSESSQHFLAGQTLLLPLPTLSFMGFRTVFEMEQQLGIFKSGLYLMENIKQGRHKLLESQSPSLAHRTGR